MTSKFLTAVQVAVQMLALCAHAQPPPDGALGSGDVMNLNAALLQLNAGVRAKDVYVVRAFLFAENDLKLSLVEAHAQRIIAGVRFHEEASRLLGGATAGRLAAQNRIVNPSDFGMFLLAPHWQIAGNTAAPTVEEAAVLQRNEVNLPQVVNCNGVWKLQVTPRSARDDPDAVAEAVKRHALIVSEAATAMAEGRLKTVDEVQRALRQLPHFAAPRFRPDVVIALAETATTKRAEEKTERR